MADVDNTDKTGDKKKRKSIIASLDLKNYKAKYTDSYGLGKPNEADLDNFLIAEPDPKSEDKKESKKNVAENTQKVVSVPTISAAPTTSTNSNIKNEIQTSESVVDKTIIKKTADIPKTVTNRDRDSDFERRVNAEADNDFFDDKPAQQTSNTFHSKVVKPNVDNNLLSIDDDKPKEIKPNRKINIREPIKVNVRHEIRDRTQVIEDIEIESSEKKPVRRTETYGIVLSAVAFIYSIFTKDKPLLFFSVSLLLYLLRPVIAAPFGKHSQSVQNAIKGFSMALFFGSIFFIFF